MGQKNERTVRKPLLHPSPKITAGETVQPCGHLVECEARVSEIDRKVDSLGDRCFLERENGKLRVHWYRGFSRHEGILAELALRACPSPIRRKQRDYEANAAKFALEQGRGRASSPYLQQMVTLATLRSLETESSAVAALQVLGEEARKTVGGTLGHGAVAYGTFWTVGVSDPERAALAEAVRYLLTDLLSLRRQRSSEGRKT